ncbi:MAG: hypothetical protein IT443_04935 [Phycisphaeraceae bacterium]|nr:hypothetical protein [Phycisphaeraceae bacterium]
MKTIFSATLCLLLMLSWAVPAQEAREVYDLRPRFEAGRTSRYEFWTRRSSRQALEARGQRQQTRHEVIFQGQITWTIDTVAADGAATATYVMDWIKADLTTADGRRMTIDSRQSSGEPAALWQVIRAMAGAPIRVELSPDAVVDKISGVEAIRGKLEEAMAKSVDESDLTKSVYDTAILAGGPAELKVGQKWPFTFARSHEMGQLTYDTTFSLAGVETIADIPIATVQGQAKVRFEPDAQRVARLPAGSSVRLTEGSSEQQVLWDLQRHEAVGRNNQLHFTLQTTIRVQGQTLEQTLDEEVQSQILRIGEE